MSYALLRFSHGSDWKHRPTHADATVLAVGDDKAALEEQADQEAEKGFEAAVAEEKEIYERAEESDVPFDPDDCDVRLLTKAAWGMPHLNFSDEEPSFVSYLVVELPTDSD